MSPMSRRPERCLVMIAGISWALESFAQDAHAATTLSVELSSTLRPVTHVASGSLYGVLEKQPADVANLIAPLHPNVFNNPASDVQQPMGDAIEVADRLTAMSGRDPIRLTDRYPSRPYAN